MPTSPWSLAFRSGLYDLLVPINYDRSLQEALIALDPQPTDHVLDVGCGTGRLILHMASHLRAGTHLTGVDIDESGISYARQRARRLGVADHATFVLGDMRNLTGLGSFDAAIAHFSTYTLPSDADRRIALQQLARVLRPGAILASIKPNEGYRVRDIIDEARRIEAKRQDISLFARTVRQHVLLRAAQWAMGDIERALHHGFFHRYTADELTGYLREAGFRDIQIEQTYGGCAYRAIAKLPSTKNSIVALN